MTRQELELKAKEFDSKLKQHPMSSEELQKVFCDFVEYLHIHQVVGSSEHLVAFVEWLEKQSEHLIDRGWIEEYIQATNCA